MAPLRTVFHASGTDAQLLAFIDSVTASLRALPVDRILLERRILAQEAAGRSHGPPGLLRWLRYGFAGHGLLGAEEIGLGWLGPAPIQDWARAWFTRHNAAVWWSGEPPAGLRFDLPDGERKAVVDAEPVPDLRFPARTDMGGDGVSIGYIGARSAASRVVQDTLARRLRQELRFERGLIYDVGLDYEPIGIEDAHLSIGMDCSRDVAPEVAATILRVLDDLGEHGATVEEIEREASAFAEGSAQPGGALGFLDGITFDALIGRRHETPASIIAEYQALTPDDTRAAARQARSNVLVLAPPGAADDGLAAYPSWSSGRVDGRTIRPSGWPIGPKARKDRLVVGAEGVSWVAPTGQQNTVRYADCVASRHWDGPVRELWGADGFRVVVDAAEWRDGTKIVAEVDAAVPSSVIACDEHGIGALETPERGETDAVGSVAQTGTAGSG